MRSEFKGPIYLKLLAIVIIQFMWSQMAAFKNFILIFVEECQQFVRKIITCWIKHCITWNKVVSFVKLWKTVISADVQSGYLSVKNVNFEFFKTVLNLTFEVNKDEFTSLKSLKFMSLRFLMTC